MDQGWGQSVALCVEQRNESQARESLCKHKNADLFLPEFLFSRHHFTYTRSPLLVADAEAVRLLYSFCVDTRHSSLKDVLDIRCSFSDVRDTLSDPANTRHAYFPAHTSLNPGSGKQTNGRFLWPEVLNFLLDAACDNLKKYTLHCYGRVQSVVL